MSSNRLLLRQLFTLTLLAAIAGVPLHAQPELDKRISLELEEADVRLVLESFGSVLEREVEIDPSIEGAISIELHDVRVETAITAVCESAGCVWKMDAGRLRMMPDSTDRPAKARPRSQPTPAGLDQRLDIALENADLRETLQSFGHISGMPVVIDEDVQGIVTVQLHDVPARQALDVLCDLHGCVWEMVEIDDGSSVLRVRKTD